LILPQNTVKVISSGFPMLDLKDRWYTEAFEKDFFHQGPVPESLIDDHLAAMKPGVIISAANPPARFPFLISVGRYGRWAEIIGSEPALYPSDRLESAKSFPPLFVFHRSEDSAVPAEGTVKFVQLLRRVFPDNKVVCKIEPGDHGF
jgi:hypothetical protein